MSARQVIQEMFHVDAFANKPFVGNPAAVLLSNESLTNQLMQNIATEMNLSETAFLSPNKTKGFNLRWFSPTTEVKLCGHATLSAAHILFERKIVDADQTIEFHTLSGILKAYKLGTLIVLDFPRRAVKRIPTNADIERALGKYSIGQYRTEEGDILVEFTHEADIRALTPDINTLMKIDARGIMVTAKSNEREVDFISRYFVPRCGIHEDPVTGSTHCALFPFWGDKLRKTKMTAFQASKRGGFLQGEVLDERVLLKGEAITLFELKPDAKLLGK